MKITATAELEKCLLFAAKVGCASDQLERFIQAGYIPQARQMTFHAAAREADKPDGPERIGYGGTRGQAKSHAIITQVGMDDCQRYPGLKVLYLRNIGRAATEQFEDLITKLFSLVPHDYKSSRGLLKFPNGSRIILGGFKDESEIDGYLGIEYDCIILEDATTLSETKYDAICGSLRTSKEGWRPRLYASANPGGIGHAWFKKVFVDPWLKKEETETRFVHTVMGDNVFIDEGYARYLNSLTGWLRRAWRDGDFSIAAGQFFTAFDPLIHVIKPFDFPPDWTFWLSLDYGFVHWNMIYLLAQDGDGNRYAIDELAHRRTLVPEVVKGIEAMLSRNKLTSSHLSIMVAGSDIFAQRGTTKTIAEEYAGLGFRWKPAQTDRINGAAKVMSYLGSPEQNIPARFFIFNRCHRLIETLPAMQHDPRRGEDVLKVDCNSETGEGGDDCFIAGTRILTLNGEIPIEQIAVGDLVLTRGGYQPVRAVWNSRYNASVLTATLSNGETITATPNHKFWVESKGWRCIDSLRYGDTISLWKNNPHLKQRLLYSTESPSGATPIQSTLTTVNITRLVASTLSRVWGIYTLRYGSQLTVQFLKDTISIIETLIRSITTLITSNALTPTNTTRYIFQMGESEPLYLGVSLEELSDSWLALPSGIALKKAEPGIESTAKKYGEIVNQLSTLVNNVTLSLVPQRLATFDSVPISVNLNGDAIQAQMTLRNLARNAESHLQAINIKRSDSVPVYVLDITDTGNSDTYAVHVDKYHEYYANGILVRNCYDALRYALMWSGRAGWARGT